MKVKENQSEWMNIGSSVNNTNLHVTSVLSTISLAVERRKTTLKLYFWFYRECDFVSFSTK